MSRVSANLTIIYEKGLDGWWIATVAEVQGAFSQGKTKEEAKENALDAMHELMAVRRELALKERSTSTEIEQVAFQV